VARSKRLHVPREKKKNKTPQFKAQARHNPHAKLLKKKNTSEAQAARR